MKKIFTLAFLIGVYATSYAQYNHPQYNENIGEQYATSGGQYYNGNGAKFYESNHFVTHREKDFEIARINREFRMKVYSIKRDRYLRHHQKKVAIRIAEDQRGSQIQFLNEKFRTRFHHGYGRR